MGFRLAQMLMTLDDLEIDGGRPPFFKYLNWHNSDCIQHRCMLFGSRVGFSGTSDLMVQLSNFRNPRWRLTAILDI